MKLTLLDMTQNILSSMDSDEVNSIGDTTEATQVANVIRTTYFNIIARADLPELSKLFSLDSSGDDTLPILMYRPENVAKIDWIKYNRIDDGVDTYAYVTVLPVQQYMDMIHQLDTTETYVDSVDINNQTFYYRTDKNPDYCTILNDYYIIFDSYDMDIENTLQNTNTVCYGKTIPTFTMSDSFIPELDDRQFPLLLNEAKSTCFLELKQSTNEAAAMEARRQWRTLQRTKSSSPVPTELQKFANFGR